MSDEWVSIREYARRKGISDTSVRRAINSGKIVSGKKGKGRDTKINPAVADAEWSSNFNPMYSRISREGVSLDDIFESKEKPEGEPKPTEASRKSMAEVKRKTAEVRLAHDALKLKKLQGQLVDKDQVYKNLYAAGQEVRTKLQAIPDRVIDDILAARDRSEARGILFNAISDTLDDISEIQNRDIAK